MSTHTSYWLNFFREAGLPDKIGTKYAVIFASERVDPSMLSEISRDILKDMGITAMGDIIAILRHARAILDKTNEEKTLEGMVRSTPAGRMIAHYVSNNSEKTTSSQRAAPDPPKPPKRSVPDAGVNYKVVMPKGTTPKTRAILEKMRAAKAAKAHASMEADKIQPRSVFSRLATSGAAKAETGVAPASNFKSDGSVFHRLGPRSSGGHASKTVSAPKPLMEQRMPASAEYHGILKTPTAAKRRISEVGFTSSAAGGGVTSGYPSSHAKRARLTAKVVRAEATSTTHSEGIFAQAARRPMSSSVHSRLGIGAKETTSHRGLRSAPLISKSSQAFRVTGAAPVVAGPLPPRRVTPEIEGRYKVTLPRGTTPKTRAILQKLRERRGRDANGGRKQIVWDL